MAEGAGGDAGSAPAPVPGSPASGAPQDGAAVPGDAPLLGGGAGSDAAPEGLDGGDGGSPAEAAWRDDWRDRLVEKLPAAEREKELARLKRFASPENVYKSLRELERKQSTGALKAALPENPSPEEVAAYRKANGIPDNPDGYGLAFPETIQADDGLKSDLAGFQKHMHDANVPPSAVKPAFDYFMKMTQDAAQRRHEAAKEAKVNNLVELRSEYGKDFKANVSAANGFIAKYAGEKAPDLVGLQLADGTVLGDHPEFIRFAVNAGLELAEDGAIETGGGASGGSMLDRYKTIMMNPRSTPAEKAEAQELAAKMDKKGINYAL
ncbi:hypothetical protein [Enterovirga sp. CN4-39]|uniref:hypothetical protein n=1 Tax=Enterovirga sp. CN4-39 TaxID=3400910 RepID=UPI003BFDD934